MSDFFLISSEKPQLIPVSVSWQISPSGAFLYLSSSLEDATRERPTVVSLLANFENGRCQIIELSFQMGLWARICPCYTGSEVVDESQYDWTAVDSRWKPDQDPDQWIKKFQQKWKQTGTCPDPGMYEIINSGWLKELIASSSEHKYYISELKHYLILGNESSIEVIASDFEWNVKEQDIEIVERKGYLISTSETTDGIFCYQLSLRSNEFSTMSYPIDTYEVDPGLMIGNTTSSSSSYSDSSDHNWLHSSCESGNSISSNK